MVLYSMMNISLDCMMCAFVGVVGYDDALSFHHLERDYLNLIAVANCSKWLYILLYVVVISNDEHTCFGLIVTIQTHLFLSK